MCFSATGSFIAAGLNAAAGVAVLRKSSGPANAALAGYPFLFAAQQAIEGALWLSLPEGADSAFSHGLANLFVFMALAIWPVFVPFSTALVEESPTRKSTFRWISAVGFAYSFYAIVGIVRHPYDAQILGYTLSYSNGEVFPPFAAVVYGICVCVPLLLSSARTLRLLGACVFTGLLISIAFYYFTLLSVWCFFAAVASGILFFRAYVELPREHSLTAEAAKRGHTP